MYDTLRKMRQHRNELEDQAANEGGFTLIELLVVVVIIGILVAIAIPLYLHFENGAKASSAETDTHALTNLVKLCQSDNGGTLPATRPAQTGSFSFSEAACAADTQNLSTTNSAVYTNSGGGDFTIQVTNTESGKVATYDSATGQTVLS